MKQPLEVILRKLQGPGWALRPHYNPVWLCKNVKTIKKKSGPTFQFLEFLLIIHETLDSISITTLPRNCSKGYRSITKKVKTEALEFNIILGYIGSWILSWDRGLCWLILWFYSNLSEAEVIWKEESQLRNCFHCRQAFRIFF